MPKKKLLITGGCGFIGSNLVAFLTQENDYEIRILDNLSLGSKDTVSAFDVELIQGDILEESVLDNALQDIDAVIHLAAHTRVIESIDNPLLNFRTNVIGTYNLLSLCRNKGITKIINASTGGAILGEATPPINEDMVANPMSPYGASKLSSEAYSSAFNHSYGMKISSLRFSNVYGPYSFHKGSVVAHFFKQIIHGDDLTVYGDGTQSRDFVFSRDLCEGIKLAVENDAPGVYQLGSGKPTSLNQLIDLIRKIVGDTLDFKVVYKDFRQGEIIHTWTDISKAGKYLGYQPSTNLAEGLKRTWEWFSSSYEKRTN